MSTKKKKIKRKIISIASKILNTPFNFFMHFIYSCQKEKVKAARFSFVKLTTADSLTVYSRPL